MTPKKKKSKVHKDYDQQGKPECKPDKLGPDGVAALVRRLVPAPGDTSKADLIMLQTLDLG